MSQKLYLRDALAPGASDILYISRADGSADGNVSFTGLVSVLTGVLSGAFSVDGHTHVLADITNVGSLATYAAITPSANVQTILGAADYSAIRTALGLVISTNVQAYNANLTTYATIAPSANVQTLLGAANFAAFRSSLSIGAIGLLSTVTEADQTLADNTTNNVSTTKHGYAPKAPNDATKYLDGTGAYSVPAGSGGTATIVQPQTRLSLTTGVAVMIADATAQGTVYCVPYTGKYVPVYDGAAWAMQSVGSQISLTLNSTDNLLEKLYDIFVFNNGGTITLGTGPAWINTATITVTIATPGVVTWTAHGLAEGAPVVFTNSGGALPTGITAGTTYYVSKTGLAANTFSISTSVANAAAGTNITTSGSQSGTHTGTNATTIRGTGAGTTELELKDGIWTNKNAIALKGGGSTIASPAANKATYLGTIYCTANGQTGVALKPAAASGGAANILGLYNAYNRVRIDAVERDSQGAVDYSYGTTTWRAANSNVNNRISWVDGLQQSRVLAINRHLLYSNSASGHGAIGTTLDSTSTAPEDSAQGGTTGAILAFFPTTVQQPFAPQLGFHFAQRMEVATGGTVFFSGSATSPTRQNNGLTLTLEM